MIAEYEITLADLLSVPVGIDNDVVRQTASGLRAKLNAAALTALRLGHSWAEGPMHMDLGDIWTAKLVDPQLVTATIKAGPVHHDWQPPHGWRVIRHADWIAAGRPGDV